MALDLAAVLEAFSHAEIGLALVIYAIASLRRRRR